MASTEVQVGVVALLEQCAQRRAGARSAPYQDELTQATRMLQAEAAGRELMAALVRPDPFFDLSLAGAMRRLVNYLQTVLTASTSDDQIAPLLTTRMHRVLASSAVQRLLCDAMLLLVLTAIDDDATGVEVRLERIEERTILTVESDRLGAVDELAALQSVRSAVAGSGGEWVSRLAEHGGSWIVIVAMPFESSYEQETRHGN